MTATLDDFLRTASRFCSVLADGLSTEDGEQRAALSTALAHMYATAMDLPQAEPSTAVPLPATVSRGLDRSAIPRSIAPHWSTPGDWRDIDTPPEPFLSDVFADLIEIQDDVTKIIDNADAGSEDLVWQARFDFEVHWSWHALDALRALHPTR